MNIMDTERYAMSHTQIARVLGVHPTRVAQIERSALRKLRQYPLIRQHLEAIIRQPQPATPYQEQV